jgi:predicted transcriptional regulator
MYESPIEIITMADEIIKRNNEATENEVLEAIFRVGVNVDKEELIKALRYDREQYAKGYNDGIRDFAERLKEKRAGWGYPMFVLEIDAIDNLVKEMAGE